MNFERNPCLRYRGMISDKSGGSKCNKGGLKAAKAIPVSIVICDEEISSGINPYKMLQDHNFLCLHTANKNDVF